MERLYAYHRGSDSDQSRLEVACAYSAWQDKEENILAPVEGQLYWLRQIGNQDVGCSYKVFELALFGGRKGS